MTELLSALDFEWQHGAELSANVKYSPNTVTQEK
jgi:hypothetical protein